MQDRVCCSHRKQSSRLDTGCIHSANGGGNRVWCRNHHKHCWEWYINIHFIVCNSSISNSFCALCMELAKTKVEDNLWPGKGTLHSYSDACMIFCSPFLGSTCTRSIHFVANYNYSFTDKWQKKWSVAEIWNLIFLAGVQLHLVVGSHVLLVRLGQLKPFAQRNRWHLQQKQVLPTWSLWAISACIMFYKLVHLIGFVCSCTHQMYIIYILHDRLHPAREGVKLRSTRPANSAGDMNAWKLPSKRWQTRCGDP